MKSILILSVLFNSAFTMTMAGGVETIYKLRTAPGGVETILAKLEDLDQAPSDPNEFVSDFYQVTDDNVPASSVYAVENLSASELNASLVTVYRGSANNTSSVIVTFSKSLEDISTSYEFYNLKEAPTNVTLKELSPNTFEFSFDAEFLSYDKANDITYFSKQSLSFAVRLDEDGNVISFAKLVSL